MKTIGSRAEVMHGTAHHTSGGLTKKDLKYNKSGKIVSRKKSELGKHVGLKRLRDAGYVTKKGQFGVFKDGKLLTKKRSTTKKAKRSPAKKSKSPAKKRKSPERRR